MELAQVSFAHGEVSPIAAARTDAAFYASALSVCLNFFVRAEGAVSNRPGTYFIAQCVSATQGSYLVPFIYNNQQAYLLEMSSSPLGQSPGSINIYLSGSLIESVGAPYEPTDLANIRWAQSADTLNLVVATQPLYQLKRVTVNSFTLTAPTLLNGPFQDVNTDGTTYVYASGTQGTVTITASAPIFQPGHVGGLFYIEEQFLNPIQPWTANGYLEITTSSSSPVGMYVRSDSKIYQCVAANASTTGTAMGTYQPVHLSGTVADGAGLNVPNLAGTVGVSWQFVSQQSGVALITGYIDPQHVTAVIQSDKGIYSNYPPTVVGPPVSVEGPFNFTGTGSQKTFTGLTGITTGDPNQFLVTIAGIFSDPTTYSINLSGTSITFNQAPANGAAIVVSQVTGQGSGNTLIKGLPISTYWAFGSFSQVQGYPATVVYYNDRLVLGGTQLQPQTLFTSKTGNYLDFGTSTPLADDDDITVTLNARRENAIVDLISQNDLLIGTSSAITRLTHSASSGSITPSDVAALPQNFYGQQAVPSVQTGDTTIYVQWGGRKIRDLIYQFQTDKYQGTELTVFARQMFPYGTTCVRMAFAPEPYGLLFCVRSDGVMCVCAYLPEQQVIAWSRYTTAGFFEDVCVLPENGTFSVYVIVRRTIAGTQVRYIEKFAAREYLTPQDAFFVDSGLTYDGRQTSTVLFTPNVSSLTISNVVILVLGNALNVLVFTTTPHGLAVGQTISLSEIIGTGTYAALSGTYSVSDIQSPTEFIVTLTGTSVTGAYTSGGVVISSQSLFGNTGVITCSAAVFQSTDPSLNNSVWITDSNGNRLCRLQITAFASSTSVNVRALDAVPPQVPNTSQKWTFAKTLFSGLTNLIGQSVAVYADGGVPPQQTVSSTGTVTLPTPGGVVHIGLPYVCQLQSLSPNIQGQPTIRDHAKTITKLSVIVDQSLPIKAGPNFNTLTQLGTREFETYGQPPSLKTGVIDSYLLGTLDTEAVICVQQDQPVPTTVLGWVAEVEVGTSG